MRGYDKTGGTCISYLKMRVEMREIRAFGTT